MDSSWVVSTVQDDDGGVGGACSKKTLMANNWASLNATGYQSICAEQVHPFMTTLDHPWLIDD